MVAGNRGANDQRAQLESLYAAMAPCGLLPLWESLHALVLPEPASPARPWRWDYDETRDFLMRAGDIISAEQAERRVLIMENPGLPGQSAITPSLYAGLQSCWAKSRPATATRRTPCTSSWKAVVPSLRWTVKRR